MKRYSQEELYKILHASVLASNQTVVAKNLGISPQFLHDIIKKRRPISGRTLQKMGFEMRTYYVMSFPLKQVKQ